MKFIKISLIIFMLFSIKILDAAVLSQIDISGTAKNIGDSGQFNNAMSFNNNPVSVGNAENLAVQFGYARFFNALNYNLNAFSLNTVSDFKFLQAGMSISYFQDSDSIINYNEFRFNVALASDYFFKKLKVGLGLNMCMENMSISYSEDLIDGNNYSNNEFDIDLGISYEIKNLKFSGGIKNLLLSKYFIAGIGYQFSKISVAGISLKYKDNEMEISLGMANTIIDKVLNVYFGASKDSVTSSAEIRIFNNIIKKGNMFFSYTLNYNFSLHDTHYLNVKYEF